MSEIAIALSRGMLRRVRGGVCSDPLTVWATESRFWRRLRTRFIAVIAIALVLSPWISVLAKRMAPKPVAPVTQDGIEYSAPLDRMGFVVATWTKTKREIWSRQIYVIKYEYKKGLEEDVQWCFITSLQFENGKLKVMNEKGGEFELDPETLDIKVLKGTAVIDHTRD